MPFRNLALAILFAVIFTTAGGCAMFKKVVRTIDDIASDACVLFATENADDLAGLSPADFCDVRENLEPFVEYITRAQQTAGGMAVSRGAN